MTFDPGTPPAEAATDDHVLATWLATVAGERLLEVRGEGTVFDTRQKGSTDLRLASILRDRQVVEDAREVAFELVGADPGLADHPELRDEVELFLDDEQRAFLERS